MSKSMKCLHCFKQLEVEEEYKACPYCGVKLVWIQRLYKNIYVFTHGDEYSLYIKADKCREAKQKLLRVINLKRSDIDEWKMSGCVPCSQKRK